MRRRGRRRVKNFKRQRLRENKVDDRTVEMITYEVGNILEDLGYFVVRPFDESVVRADEIFIDVDTVLDEFGEVGLESMLTDMLGSNPTPNALDDFMNTLVDTREPYIKIFPLASDFRNIQYSTFSMGELQRELEEIVYQGLFAGEIDPDKYI